MPEGLKVLMKWCWVHLGIGVLLLVGGSLLGYFSALSWKGVVVTVGIMVIRIVYEVLLLLGIYFESKKAVLCSAPLLLLSLIISCLSYVMIQKEGYPIWPLSEMAIVLYLGLLLLEKEYFT